jgi:hypothetical protein
MPGELRKVDPQRGLQDLVQQDEKATGRTGFRFQLKYLKEQCEDILYHLDSLIRNTRAQAPQRPGEYHLDRRLEERAPRGEEARWEWVMWEKWGPRSHGETYLPNCPHIQTYQFPLKGARDDSRWGKVDLLGVSPARLPVINEVKKRQTTDSVLRTLIEMCAYGVALQEVWPKLKPEWELAMRARFSENLHLPDRLDSPSLIGVAPQDYWNRQLGLSADAPRGRVPKGAWPAFWALVDAFRAHFDINFAIVEGTWREEDSGPEVTGARLLDLRAETS